MTTEKLDRHAVDAAYQAHVQLLFKTLVSNMSGIPSDEQVCLSRFAAGLDIGRRAYALVCDYLEAPPIS